MIIREAADKDHAACAVIFGAAWSHAFPHLPRTIDEAIFRGETLGERVFVAEHADRVIGFASLYEPDAFLHHLYVDPAHHGAGVGTALLRQAIAAATAPLTLKCQRGNTNAVRFYARRGFTEFASGDSTLGPWAHLRAPLRGRSCGSRV
jgi:GNAT superfamily N-acetyltransferase